MAIYTPTYIYLGNKPALINPDWNGVGAARSTSETEAQVVAGWSFDSDGMQGVQVTGNVPTGNNFRRGIDELTYTLNDGSGGSITRHAVYTSHVVVKVTIDVVRYEPGNPAANAQGHVHSTVDLRGVVVQMENGDIFMRPYYLDQSAWETTLNSWAIDQIHITSVANQSDNTDAATGGFSAATSFPPEFVGDLPVAPCFAAGTLIATATGERAIEDLAAGDQIMTASGEARPIRWIGKRRVSALQLQVAGYLRPVRIAADAFGPGRPAQDLLVSPQHRVVVSSHIAERMFGQGQVLIAAKHLVGLPGVTIAAEVTEVTYFHLLLDQHQIIASNGLLTESLLPRDQVLSGLGTEAERELRHLFPQLFAAEAEVEAALPCIAGRRARSLLRRHSKNQHQLAAPSVAASLGKATCVAAACVTAASVAFAAC
ncbi:Hint domain-containing protein [Xinfangfangia sp. D13-10-4-6]|uniref:Hint domain-containing protein n=1 Tax=Pseudogemmobacter hezensis TaxID=2737662 RepID=UPI001552E5CB|nr:Hint domain-containing protein [Pseudogemmobacter hezensis]NPD17215.1 Hint domain-containing protein [Pseudogemmobacter hezensis]